MLWGNNPVATWLAQASAIGEGRKKGARMLVIDPRHTEFARDADVWLNINPGTDAVLAMGFIRQLLEEGYNEAFVRTWTDAPLLVNEDSGRLLRERDITSDAVTNHYLLWDSVDNIARCCTDAVAGDEVFYQRASLVGRYSLPLANGETAVCTPALEVLRQAVAGYTLEHVATVTGVSIKTTGCHGVNSAFITHCVPCLVGIAQSQNATQTERAIAILYALTGAFDTRGSNRIYAKPPFNAVNPLSLLPESQRQKALDSANVHWVRRQVVMSRQPIYIVPSWNINLTK